MIYAFDDFELDTGRFELRGGGAVIPLERQVFDVLAYLVQNNERVVRKEELQDNIWGDRFVSEAALSTRVMAARKAIGDSGREQRMIKTVHGRGFRFVADVHSAEDGAPAQRGARGASTDGRGLVESPPIQYCHTSDGVNIAYWAWGAGTPLIVMPDWIWSHVRSELRLPEVANWYRDLAERWRVVRYDGRGEGLSDRKAPDYSLAGRVRDLEAVAALQGPAAIFAHVSGTLTAISYAAANPERVTHLVLWCGYASSAEFGDTPQLRALTALVHNDWEMFVENIARSRITGWRSGTETSALTRYLRDAAEPEYAATAMESLASVDVSGLLAKVNTPTLVIHCSGVRVPSIDASRGLAAAIPDARLCILEGNAPIPHLGPTGPALRTIEEFVGTG